MTIDNEKFASGLGTASTATQTARSAWTGIGLVGLINNEIDFARILRTSGRTPRFDGDGKLLTAPEGEEYGWGTVTGVPALRIPRGSVLMGTGVTFVRYDSRYRPAVDAVAADTEAGVLEEDAITGITGKLILHKGATAPAATTAAREAYGNSTLTTTSAVAADAELVKTDKAGLAANNVLLSDDVLLNLSWDATGTNGIPYDAKAYVWAIVANVAPAGYFDQLDYNNLA